MTSNEIEVGALCTDVIRQVIAGERALLQMSLASMATGPMPANVLVSPRIAFMLRIDQTWDRRRGFLAHILDEAASRDVVANVRVSFTVRPSPEPVTGPGGEVTLTLLLPSFVTYHDDNRLEFAMEAGKRVAVMFTSDNRVILRDSGGSPIAVSDRWPLEPLTGILDRTAHWLRQGAAGVPRVFDPTRDIGLGKLLHTIAAYRGEIRSALDESVETVACPRPDRHPDLDAVYVIEDFQAKALLKLDNEGRVALGENGKNWQQKLDFEVRPSKSGIHAGFVISIRPPDFLVDGPYHQKFLGALREAQDLLRAALADLRPSRDGFESFLASLAFEDGTLFVRIDNEDHDLVLIRGALDGRSVEALLMVHFDASALPDGEPRVMNVERISVRDRSAAWIPERVSRAQQKRIGPYMLRALRTARSWGLVVRREPRG